MRHAELLSRYLIAEANQSGTCIHQVHLMRDTISIYTIY